jgi:hypothetical protein
MDPRLGLRYRGQSSAVLQIARVIHDALCLRG